MMKQEPSNEICQVCGNSSASKCYNAIVCGRCRVFFARCVMNSKPVPCDKLDCQITSKRRGNCSWCRFQRCLAVNMHPDEVGKIRRTCKTRQIPLEFYKECMEYYHSTILSRQSLLAAEVVHSIQKNHKISLNELGPSPSSSPINLNISLSDFLKDPTLCTSRDTACFDNFSPRSFSPGSEEKIELVNVICRPLVTFWDFLMLSKHFEHFSDIDKKRIIRHNYQDFLIFSYLETIIKSNISLTNWQQLLDKFNLKDYEKLQFLKRIQLVFLLRDEISSIVEELDETALLLLKLISCFSPPINISDDGRMKTNSAKETFSLYLSKHISKHCSDLPNIELLMRIDRLLSIVRHVKWISEVWTSSMTSAVMENHGGLNGELTFELFVKRD